MDIKDFKARKLKLESDIAQSVSQLINEFEEETGYNPCAIDIEMLDVTSCGDAHGSYILSRVHIKINL